MTLAPGTKLGPYEINSPLGAGGMGEVYRARDARLGREVAVKILPEDFLEDEDRRKRFEREARVLATLNHPGIGAIYSFEEIPGSSLSSSSSSSRHVLVMELVEGEDLGQRLLSGPLSLEESLSVARQIAEALEAAHEKGIVHRDLKPANVKVTEGGKVKLLDFGLAKAFEGEGNPSKGGSGGGVTASPTLTARATAAGVILGTAAYMSPEQARGKSVDKRTDVWAFGCVFYEMLTGRRAFEGETVSDTLAAILTKEPDWGALRAPISSKVRELVRRCLQRDARQRLRDIGDARIVLEEEMAAAASVAGAGGASAASPAPLPFEGSQAAPGPTFGRGATAVREGGSRRVLHFSWAIAGAIAVAAGVVGVLALRARAPSAPRFRQITYHRGTIESARFSPDGQTVVFGSTRRDEPLRIYSARLDSIEYRPLDLPAGATVVGVSRTGEMALLLHCAHYGYWMRKGTLARVALGGGAPREILENVADADISPDGKDFAVVREVGRLQRLEYPIGKLVLETAGWVSSPRISPDGKQVAFLEHPVYGSDSGYVSLAPAGGRPERVSGGWSAAQGLAWSREGEEIWVTVAQETEEQFSNGVRHQLWAIRPGVKPRLVYGPPMSLCIHDVSATGAVLLSGEDRRGEVGGLLKGETKERDFSTWSDEVVGGISEDGSVFVGIEQSAPGAGLDPILYYRRAGESSPVRLGTGSAIGISPDGHWVLSRTAGPGGAFALSLVPTGPGEPRPLPIGNIRPRAVLHEPAHWSLDGRRILFSGEEPGRPARLFLLDVDGGAPRPATPEGISQGVLSPDGNSVAALDAAGKMLVFAVSGGPPAEVRGALPDEFPLEWEADGTALFVWDRKWPARIYRLELSTGHRTLWKELAPDPVGLMYGDVILTHDGRHYVYRLRRVFSELNVAEGLR
ncbi:MAG: protein kinase domain-containing protein [Acidithiobacillales bacterium]